MQEMQEMGMPSPGQEEPLEKAMAAHSSVLAWRAPRTEEPGGLQSIGLQSWIGQKRLSMHTALKYTKVKGSSPKNFNIL